MTKKILLELLATAPLTEGKRAEVRQYFENHGEEDCERALGSALEAETKQRLEVFLEKAARAEKIAADLKAEYEKRKAVLDAKLEADLAAADLSNREEALDDYLKQAGVLDRDYEAKVRSELAKAVSL